MGVSGVGSEGLVCPEIVGRAYNPSFKLSTLKKGNRLDNWTEKEVTNRPRA